jgi:hypothetical protein
MKIDFVELKFDFVDLKILLIMSKKEFCQKKGICQKGILSYTRSVKKNNFVKKISNFTP